MKCSKSSNPGHPEAERLPGPTSRIGQVSRGWLSRLYTVNTRNETEGVEIQDTSVGRRIGQSTIFIMVSLEENIIPPWLYIRTEAVYESPLCNVRNPSKYMIAKHRHGNRASGMAHGSGSRVISGSQSAVYTKIMIWHRRGRARPNKRLPSGARSGML